MHDFDKIYKGFQFGLDLKRVKRTGYVRRDVPDPESSADHTFGLSLLAILLDEFLPPETDKEKLYKLCILHDLPESVCGDTPPEDMAEAPRHKMEEEAAIKIALASENQEIKELCQEYDRAETLEAKLAKDIDKIETLMQVLDYINKGDMDSDKNNFFDKYINGEKELKTELGQSFLTYLIENKLTSYTS